jgi:hypothetical protein
VHSPCVAAKGVLRLASAARNAIAKTLGSPPGSVALVATMGTDTVADDCATLWGTD